MCEKPTTPGPAPAVNRYIRTPNGVTDYLPKDRAAMREIETRVESLFRRFGYETVKSPMFEYAGVFEGISNPDEMHKFIDRDGSVLTLRPDMTPAIARIASANFACSDVPLRFCYVENAFRYNEHYQGKLREFTQAGVELIGVESDEADAEVISVAINALKAAGLTEFRLDIGHAGFLTGVIEECRLKQADAETIMEHARNKDYASVERLASGRDIPRGAAELLANLCLYIGGVDMLSKCESLIGNTQSAAALTRLKNIYDILKSCGLERYISFDLGMTGALNYYTGIIFRGYTHGTGFSIADGGRYDNLCERFGKGFPAVGFAIRLNNLLPALRSQQIEITVDAADTLVGYSKEGRGTALRMADALRDTGLYIENCLTSGDAESVVCYAEQRGVNGVLYFADSERLELIDLTTGVRTETTCAEIIAAAETQPKERASAYSANRDAIGGGIL